MNEGGGQRGGGGGGNISTGMQQVIRRGRADVSGGVMGVGLSHGQGLPVVRCDGEED